MSRKTPYRPLVRSLIVLAVLTAAAAFILSHQHAEAAATTFTVNSLADTNDGTCDAADCTLREALNAANSNPGADTIDFSVTGTINLTGALPYITDDVSINGPGANNLTVRRDTGGFYRIFEVTSMAGSGVVTFSDLTISNGRPGIVSESGGAILNLHSLSSTVNVTNCILDSNSAPGSGGAILNGYTLNVTNSTISNNSSQSFGGAILNYDTTTITNSTISNNSAGHGGGIGNLGGTLSVINSTLSNNSSSGSGGAIFSGNTGFSATVIVTSSTLSNNSANIGGALVSASGVMSLDSSVIALNTATASGPDLSGVITSLGYNIVSDPSGSAFVPGAGDQVGVTAAQLNLGALQNNGGPTPTMALGTGSVAIDAGDDALTGPPHNLNTDQRGPGFARKYGARVDVGAFELQQADGCPDDPNKTEPGVCGCGVPDTDSDGDSTPDCLDQCPSDPNKTAPGACGCGFLNTDSDGDGVSDCIDNCPARPNSTQTDWDNDGVGDACDPPDSKEQCKKGGWTNFIYPRTFKSQGDCFQ